MKLEICILLIQFELKWKNDLKSISGDAVLPTQIILKVGSRKASPTSLAFVPFLFGVSVAWVGSRNLKVWNNVDIGAPSQTNSGKDTGNRRRKFRKKH